MEIVIISLSQESILFIRKLYINFMEILANLNILIVCHEK